MTTRTKINIIIFLLLSLTGIVTGISMAVIVRNGIEQSAVYKVQSDLALTMKYLDAKFPGPWRDDLGNLYKGQTAISGNSAIVDELGQLTGNTVTFFLGKTRVNTNIFMDGKRAVGTSAAENIARSVLIGGNTYIGEAKILGQKFQSAYLPLRDENKRIIGMLYMGAPDIFLSKTIHEMFRNFILIFISTLAAVFVSSLLISYFFSAPIEELKKKNEELEKAYSIMETLATTDFLTKLHNRRSFLQKIEHELYRYERSSSVFSVIMADLDNFKAVNDTWGHDTGDYILKEVSVILTSNIRKHDIAARWGGEEFIILLYETGITEAAAVAEKIRQKIEEYPFEFKNQKIKLTCTFGAAEFRPELGIDGLTKEADIALYRGKKSGKNCVVKAGVSA
jgi:diguanylate cyclase (GGDEF)-like protein